MWVHEEANESRLRQPTVAHNEDHRAIREEGPQRLARHLQHQSPQLKTISRLLLLHQPATPRKAKEHQKCLRRSRAQKPQEEDATNRKRVHETIESFIADQGQSTFQQA